MQRTDPVATQEKKGQHVLPGKNLPSHKLVERPGNPDKEEIKRPNSQDAAHVEGFHIKKPTLRLFSHQQLRNKVRAQHKKQVNTEVPGPQSIIAQANQGRHQRHYRVTQKLRWNGTGFEMIKENAKKREEAKHIQLRPIKALSGSNFRPGGLIRIPDQARWDHRSPKLRVRVGHVFKPLDDVFLKAARTYGYEIITRRSAHSPCDSVQLRGPILLLVIR